MSNKSRIDIVRNNKALFFVSIIALALLMSIFSELFLFNKFIAVPTWLRHAPKPFGYFDFPGFTRAAIFIGFIPLLFVKTDVEGFLRLWVLVLLVAPLPAVCMDIFSLLPKMTDLREIMNIPFQYLWILIYHFSLPAFVIAFPGMVINELRDQREAGSKK